jgi:hypothetical protein
VWTYNSTCYISSFIRTNPWHLLLKFSNVSLVLSNSTALTHSSKCEHTTLPVKLVLLLELIPGIYCWSSPMLVCCPINRPSNQMSGSCLPDIPKTFATKYNLQQGITWLTLRWRAQLYVLIRYESQDLFTDFSNAKGGLSFGCWLRLVQGYLKSSEQFMLFFCWRIDLFYTFRTLKPLKVIGVYWLTGSSSWTGPSLLN